MIRIKLGQYCSGKSGGGPKTFIRRLMNYLESTDQIRLVDTKEDVYFTSVWIENGEISKKSKVIFRSASCYYDRARQKTFKLNKRIKNSFSHADHVVYQSNFGMKLLRNVLNAPKKNYTIIHNGFDESLFSNIEPARIKHYKKVFVANAIWDSYKRLELLVSCFIKAKIEGSCLVVLGPTTFKTKAENVIMVGSAAFETVASYLKAAHYFVHLSYVEICPNAVIEAIRFGKPVLCNNIGGTPEVVQDSGIICQCDDEFIFRRRLVNINKVDYDKIVSGFHDVIGKNFELKDRNDLTMKYCAEKYMNVFTGVLS